jgi:hypothetical protein
MWVADAGWRCCKRAATSLAVTQDVRAALTTVLELSDAREGPRAFMEKRKPTYTGR